MNTARSIVCFLLALALFGLMFYLRGPEMLARVVNWVDLAVIFGGTFALGFISFSPGETGKSIVAGWSKKPYSQDDRRKHYQVLKSLSRNAIVLGIITFTVYFFLTLGSLYNPATIAPTLSRAVLPLFYGLFLAEIILRPLANQSLKRIESPAAVAESRRDKQEIILIVVVIILAVVSMLLALWSTLVMAGLGS